MNIMIWVWLGAIVVFGITEAATAGLVSIWFAVGALAALLVTLLGMGITGQIVVFLAVSALSLALTRPLVKKYQSSKVTPTNADRVLGRTAKVTETIDNDNSTGVVYTVGKSWTARSSDGTVIPTGNSVLVERIDGVKLLVKLDTEMEETV